MELKKPILPAEINADTVRRYKAKCREYDAERLRLKLTTPDKINAENSMVSRGAVIRIQRFSSL